jgi:hypothetical protein
MVGLVWSDDPKSYVGDSVAIEGASHATDRSKVMTQTKGDTLILQAGGWVWADNPTP